MDATKPDLPWLAHGGDMVSDPIFRAGVTKINIVYRHTHHAAIG